MTYKYFILILVFSFFINHGTHAQECNILIWADEFDGDSLDLNNWNYDIGNGCPTLCGWGNNEQQYYTNSKENVYVENGILTIKAKNDTLGGMMFSSGRISTKNKADFRYGRFEASIKLPETQGLWPAFWMLSTDNVYGGWPQSGEIDILELLGHEPDQVLGTIHTGLPWIFETDTFSLEGGATFVDTFHTFALEWEPDTIKWFVDGMQYHMSTPDSISPWDPFYEDFHLILNVAVGGNLPGFTDENTVLPQTMEVDWVRVYGMPSDLQISGKDPIKGESNSEFKTLNISGANYDWSVPEGSTITEGQGSNKISVDWGCSPGDINLEVQTQCDTVNISYSVDQFDEIVISGPEIVKQNEENIKIEIPEIGNASYAWTLPDGTSIISGDGSNSIIVNWGCLEGEVIVETEGVCGSSADTLTVGLETYAISGFIFVPENSTGQVYSIPEIQNAAYLWTVPEGASIVTGQGTNKISVDFGEQGGIVQAEVTNSCGTMVFMTSISINPALIYCNFDGTDLEWGVFGSTFFEKVENPYMNGINTSQNVGKMRKNPGAVSWGGIFADLGGELDLEENPFLHMKVYGENTENNRIIKFKIEDQTTGVEPVELDVNLESSNEWVNLIWDFSDLPTETFDRIALFFDFDNVDTSYYYFDDIIGVSPETSSNSNIENGQISVYPNPTNGQINVDLNNVIVFNSQIKIQLINSTGQVVYNDNLTFNGSIFQVNTKNLPNGLYFLNVISKTKHYIKAMSIVD